MLNSNDILKVIDSLKLDYNDYCIISGGALVLYGIRDLTEDVDIFINKHGFDMLSKKYNIVSKENKYKDLFGIGDNIELLLREFDKTVVYNFNGYPVLKIEDILKWKEDNRRDKDLKDIELIKDYLEKCDIIN